MTARQISKPNAAKVGWAQRLALAWLMLVLGLRAASCDSREDEWIGRPMDVVSRESVVSRAYVPLPDRVDLGSHVVTPGVVLVRDRAVGRRAIAVSLEQIAVR